MNKVSDSSVSPYLLQRLRSLEEAKGEREKRRDVAPTQEPAPPDVKPAEPGKPGIDKKV